MALVFGRLGAFFPFDEPMEENWRGDETAGPEDPIDGENLEGL